MKLESYAGGCLSKVPARCLRQKPMPFEVVFASVNDIFSIVPPPAIGWLLRRCLCASSSWRVFALARIVPIFTQRYEQASKLAFLITIINIKSEKGIWGPLFRLKGTSLNILKQVSAEASICSPFLRGYCPNGSDCRQR